MSLPRADLLLPDGRVLRAHPGAILGRLATSAARIDDPRLHEAHALLSHRGQHLCLIALMTRFKVDQKREREVVLKAGMRVHLLDDYVIEVLRLSVPSRLTALEIRRAPPGEPPTPWRRLGTLVQDEFYTVTPEPALATGELAQALWHLWSNGVGWTLRAPGLAPTTLAEGRTWEHVGWQLRATQIDAIGTMKTLDQGHIYLPGQLRVSADGVSVVPQGLREFKLSEHGAFIVAALLEARHAAGLADDDPTKVWVDWAALAARRWRSVKRPTQLANLWYKALSRLREALRSHQIDPDLVETDGDRNVCIQPAVLQIR